MQVLKERPNHNIVTIIALFPTLTHIAKTPNGVALSVKLPFTLTGSLTTLSLSVIISHSFHIAFLPSLPPYLHFRRRLGP